MEKKKSRRWYLSSSREVEKQNYGLPLLGFSIIKYKQRDIQFYSNNIPIAELYKSNLISVVRWLLLVGITSEIVILFSIVRRQIERIRFRCPDNVQIA